jgi:hypothetical protein
MRCLLRNMRTFYFARYDRKEELVDEYGNKTGEYEVIYDNPVKCKGNISAAQGEIQSRQFGDSESYDKVIVLNNVDIPIDEYSILWVDTLPYLIDNATDTPHDYIVKKVARSLNSVSIAISKVDVNG